MQCSKYSIWGKGLNKYHFHTVDLPPGQIQIPFSYGDTFGEGNDPAHMTKMATMPTHYGKSPQKFVVTGTLTLLHSEWLKLHSFSHFECKRVKGLNFLNKHLYRVRTGLKST